MSSKTYKQRKETLAHPYALTNKDKETPVNNKPTPETVARHETLHTQAWTSDIESTNQEFISENVKLRNRDMFQQRAFIRNLYYRVKYQKKRADAKLIKLEEVLKTTNPTHDHKLYDKIERDIVKTRERLLEISSLKEKYGLKE